MRKDIVLGMSIGAVLLLLVIVYVAYSPHQPKRGPMANTGGGSAIANGSGDSGNALPPLETPRSGAAGPHNAVTDASSVSPAPAPSHPTDTSWERSLASAPRLHAEVTASTASPATRPVDPPAHDPAQTTNTGMTTVTPVAGSAPAAHTHTIRAGETPSSIAAEAYGSPNFYPYILRANPGLDPHNLKIGQVINLPDASVIHATSPATMPSAARADAPAINAKTHYVVESGDSLYKISIKLYGTASMVQAIYDLNKNEIGPDERVLKLHQILQLPKPPSVGPATQP